MSRTLPSGLDTALAAATVYPVLLVELAWPTGTVRCWSGYHDLSWGGHTWTGTGHLGSVSDIQESSVLEQNGVQLILSGIPSSVIANALENNAQGQPAKIYFGVLNGSGFTVDPYLVFDGLIDVATIQDDGTTATVTIQLEKELYDDRSAARRYTHEDLQLDYAGDMGLEYVAALANRQFTWGKTVASPAGGGGNSGGGGATDGEFQ